jgi:outer membrane protein assembly factor BamB
MRMICKSLAAFISFAALMSAGRAQEWPTFRHDNQRTGMQPVASNLSNPAEIGQLAIKWSFPTTAAGLDAFRASPIVVNGTVFIGNDNGYFYALDAATGALKWQYPNAGTQALLGGDSQWRYGIQSSAAYWNRSPDGAVIFAAQDPSLDPLCPAADPECPKGASYGSTRLIALDAKTGALIWKSDRIAEINGDSDTNGGDANKNRQLRQRSGYSPPLIFDNKVYIGVQSFENPIQIGRVIAVDLTTGHVVPAFHFQAVGTPASPLGTVRGGGVWNGPATDGTGIYFTTGNTNIDNGNPPQTTEPNPNHGVSLIRVDKGTGKIVWPYHTVPFKADCDCDWSAGATVMHTSCGVLIASVQKDGWSYAIDAEQSASGPSCPLSGNSWQFPPTTRGCLFPGGNGCPGNISVAPHGDDDYRRPGAAWNDVFIVRTGGESRPAAGVRDGYGRLHGLNACAKTEKDRVRWISDIPNNSGNPNSLGAATVTGGIIFIGTDEGHLVVLGDPGVVPGVGMRCSNTLYSTASACTAAGYSIVPIPKVLKNVAMTDGGSLVAIRNEPVLAEGHVFVGTSKGHLYMLDTSVHLNVCSHCTTPLLCCACAGGYWTGKTCE